MRKRIVKVMLFSALTLALGTSFVGCKDYDGDIENVQNQVDQLKKDLTDLKASIGDNIKSLTYDAATGKLTVVGGDNSSANCIIAPNLPTYSISVSATGLVTLTGGAGGPSTAQIIFPGSPAAPAEFDPLLLKVVGKDVYYGTIKTNVTLPSSSTGAIVETKIGDTVVGYQITIDGKTASFSVVDAVPLKGMVFEPQAYLSGIAAMKAVNLSFNPWTVNVSDATPTLVGETWKQSLIASHISPKIVAYYHLNPSSVTKVQLKSVAFKFDDKEFVGSRAATFNPIVEGYDVTNGMLKVTLKATTEQIQAIDANKVSVLALQATINVDGEGDKVITSDYAAIYKSVMKNFVLSRITDDLHHPHLYGATNAGGKIGKAQEAIDALESLEVSIGGTLDLKPLIETHYDEYTDAASPTAIRTDATLSNIADLGLKYVFTASNYITGGNSQAQNPFFTLADGVVTPKVYDTQGNAATGRMPLIRVELQEIATNKVVNVGWIKLKITKEKAPALNETYVFTPFVLSCSDKDMLLPVEFMNVKIYNALGLSKAEFESLYTLKTVSGPGTDAIIGATDNGVVTEVVDGDPEDETSVLKWSLASWPVYLDADGNFSATVTYVANDQTARRDVTVKMTATVQRPNGNIPNDNKIVQYWDAEKKYVRLNVKVPVTGDVAANCTFVTDLDNAFVGNKVTIAGVDVKFTDFAAANLTYKFIFATSNVGRVVTDANGNSYTLGVTGSGATLYSGVQNIATINATTGEIAYNEFSPIAKALLNKSAHNELGSNQTFTATIDVVVTNNCGMQLPLTNELFDAKFLRPVNVKSGTGVFVDALDNGSTINILGATGMVTLTDWRDLAFVTTPINYYDYYGVTSIVIDQAKITCNLNGKDIETTLLSSITNQITITPAYLVNTATPSYGTVTYKNNGNAVGAFKLKIPVQVTYKWGTVSAAVYVDVKATQGN